MLLHLIVILECIVEMAEMLFQLSCRLIDEQLHRISYSAPFENVFKI